MRPLLTLVGALLLLLMRPAGATAALVAAPDQGPILAGRNCGGTSKPGSLSQAGLAAEGGPGWTLGGALDKPAGIGNQLAPSIAVSPAGGVYYAWQEQRTGDFGDILAAPLAGELGAGRRAVRVDDTGVATVEQASPALAIDGAGRIHAVWEDLRGGALRRLYYAASTDGGASWGANTPLTGALPGLNHISPHLIAGPGAALYLAWDGGEDIYFSQSAGAAWSAPEPINEPRAVDRDLPRLALDAQGGLVAAWEDRRSLTPAIYVARLAQPGAGEWGGEVRATPVGVSAQWPSLAAGPDGILYLAYQGDPGIFITASADGGATWGQPQRVDNGIGNAFTNPQVAVDATGGVHCIWCQLTVNVNAAIVAARSIDHGASWGDRATLASTTGTAEPLALAADEVGNIFAAWSDDSAGTTALHTAQWSGERLYLPLLRR
jgi:hypothetical protein